MSALAFVVFVLVVLVWRWRRRRSKRELAGLNSSRPVFSVDPPPRRLLGAKDERL